MLYTKTAELLVKFVKFKKKQFIGLGYFSQRIYNNKATDQDKDSNLQVNDSDSSYFKKEDVTCDFNVNRNVEQKQVPPAATITMTSDVDSVATKNNGNGLLLYLNNYSFYAQKVLMALHEKKLSFKTHTVNIAKGEQYQSWFLAINPRGEVPVLCDGVKMIPDSARIIDYLDDNFSNGHPKLLPLDQGAEVRQKIIHFRQLIDPIPANVVTIGSFYHPKFVGKPKTPFIAPVRKALAEAEEKNIDNLRLLAEKHPNIKTILLEKAEAQEKKLNLVKDEAAFKKLLDQVDSVLVEVEKELSSRDEKDEWWLCSDQFTVADISLTILLDRLYLLGLETWLWTDGKKPGIARYYERVRQRESYKQTVPSQLTHIKAFLEMQTGLVAGTCLSSLLAVVIGGFLYFKKN